MKSTTSRKASGRDEMPITDSVAAPAKKRRRLDPRNGVIRYFLLWIIEIRGKTATLSCLALGAYMQLLIEYVVRQGPLPDDDKVLARIVRVPKKQWLEIREEILDVMYVRDGEICDEYGDRCIAEFKERSKHGRDNARKRFESVSGQLQDGEE